MSEQADRQKKNARLYLLDIPRKSTTHRVFYLAHSCWHACLLMWMDTSARHPQMQRILHHHHLTLRQHLYVVQDGRSFQKAACWSWMLVCCWKANCFLTPIPVHSSDNNQYNLHHHVSTTPYLFLPPWLARIPLSFCWEKKKSWKRVYQLVETLIPMRWQCLPVVAVATLELIFQIESYLETLI